MSRVTLEEILKTLLVDPNLPVEEGGKPLYMAAGLDLGQTFNWAPHKLDSADIAKIADLAYQGIQYKQLGCGYGVFSAFVNFYAAKYKGEYADFPLDLLLHKKGRYSGPGKTCGALLGAGKAFALFWSAEESQKMSDELESWYETASLPDYRPSKQAMAGVALNAEGKSTAQDIEISVSTAGSRLCLDSLAAWSKSCAEPSDTARKERCARLTASVAVKAAQIMNDHLAG
ncbi:MAG: C-GCAxxG-C-C family protein [Deltaproteobacteria bacterium]|nr:C-GCAxxG-C-C family protein [Deltaproteobacteria bacterium]